ncbi:interferon omega-1-like [Ursus maritimus]|uniref:Interferon omega-1-like n=1 Tax=Ursus maritimus TaxID=29073 RepID=A0A384BZQ6_URSMA|nr:interferon omega-1-like [Ursus maritimus]
MTPARPLAAAWRIAELFHGPPLLASVSSPAPLCPCSLPRWTPASIHSPECTDILVLMTQLKSVSSPTCLKDRTYFRVPWERGTVTQTQKTQSTCFHRQMLQQIFGLFSTEHSQAAWSHAALDNLLSSLHGCLEHREPREEDTLACLHLGTVVRKDFRSTHHYLEEKKYSRCAWASDEKYLNQNHKLKKKMYRPE